MDMIDPDLSKRKHFMGALVFVPDKHYSYKAAHLSCDRRTTATSYALTRLSEIPLKVGDSQRF
jgi:hypothetical protein